MEVKRYDNQYCRIDSALLKADEYCFSVLARILEGECRLTLTDNERIIVCHSSDPYPVWIWHPDDVTEQEMESAYQIAKEYFGFGGRYKFNVKYDLANYFIKRSGEEGETMKISTNMLAYSCPSPVSPKRKVGGGCTLARVEDVELAAQYRNQFCEDAGIDKTDMETHRQKARDMIAEQRLYFWCDEFGDKVAMAGFSVSGDKSCINNVYTRRDKRRRGYAANLVYALTRLVRKSGREPILYTDADYAASNACYESIGYIKRGSLCTVV